MRDWLDEGHLAWFVIDVVAKVDTSDFHARHRNDGPGRPAYDPDMMLALLFYAYGIGMRSSRRIEAACRTDAAEDAQHGLFASDELPVELSTRKGRLARLEAARSHIEAEDAAALAVADDRAAKAREAAVEGRKLRGRKPKDPHAALARAEAEEAAARVRAERQGAKRAQRAVAAGRDEPSEATVDADPGVQRAVAVTAAARAAADAAPPAPTPLQHRSPRRLCRRLRSP